MEMMTKDKILLDTYMKDLGISHEQVMSCISVEPKGDGIGRKEIVLNVGYAPTGNSECVLCYSVLWWWCLWCRYRYVYIIVYGHVQLVALWSLIATPASNQN